MLLPLITVSVLGGTVGALLLLRTPARTFDHLLPWLLLGATLIFIFSPQLVGKRGSRVGHNASGKELAVAGIFLFAVAVYGGYFGGGVGIVLLAMLAALGMTDIHAMNALKTLLSSSINGMALVMFIAARVIYWPQAVVMLLGSAIGGYFGAHYGRRLPPNVVRIFVIVVGAGMTIYFFLKTYA